MICEMAREQHLPPRLMLRNEMLHVEPSCCLARSPGTWHENCCYCKQTRLTEHAKLGLGSGTHGAFLYPPRCLWEAGQLPRGHCCCFLHLWACPH